MGGDEGEWDLRFLITPTLPPAYRQAGVKGEGRGGVF
jgi:hypothetical protein